MPVRASLGIIALLAFGFALLAAASSAAYAADPPAPPAPTAGAVMKAKPSPKPSDYGVKDTARPADPILMGEFIFRQRCAVCHAKTEGGKTAYGPHLDGISGRQAGATGWSNHSGALSGAGFAWTDDKLDAFLKDPKKTVPGIKTDVSVRFKRSRTALIAYLKSL